MMALRECRKVYGDRHIRVVAFDASYGWESVRLSFIVNRLAEESGFLLARSIRNTLDRARLRQANRLFESSNGPLDAKALSTISAEDIRASRVFSMPGNKAAGLGEGDK